MRIRKIIIIVASLCFGGIASATRVSALDDFTCSGNESYCSFYEEVIAGGASCSNDETNSALPWRLPSCSWTEVNGTSYYCSGYRGTAYKANSQGEIINRVANDTSLPMDQEISICRSLVNRFTLDSDTPLYENLVNYSFAQNAQDTNNIINFDSIFTRAGDVVQRCNGVNSLSGQASAATTQSFNLSLNGCVLSEGIEKVRVRFTATGNNVTVFTGVFDGFITVQPDGRISLPSTIIPTAQNLTGYNNLIVEVADENGNQLLSSSVALRTQQEAAQDQEASETETPTSPGSISDQFGPCNCGGGVQCSGEGADRKITSYPPVGSEEYQCVLCLGVTGNTWVGGLGCINTTPQGIFLQIIRISMGVMGGVALLRLIFLGYQYQFGDQKQIQAARDGVLATLAAIVVVLFSVLLLRIIGVNILDVVPTGFFGG